MSHTADPANVLRALAMDAVQAANSGHQGMPMGMAEIALALWGRHLRHNPANPKWADRDRFVLSNGHGPMGQGLANAVGMAIAEKMLAAEFNRPGLDIVDHHTYVFVGDGCLMEGISHEACSLAGTLGLGKLVVLYDDNRISIDSDKAHIDAWFSDATPSRFGASGWHVIPAVDGHDVDAVDRAIVQARAVTDRPSFICCKTVISKGAPNKANHAWAPGRT